MKAFRKLVSMLLLVIFVLGLLSGCKTEGVEKDEESLKVSILYADNANYPFKEDWMILEAIEEGTGAEVTYEIVTDSDYVERRTILFNSGEMPDIIAKTFSSDISTYVSSGIFLPISDYVDQMPNLKAFIEKYEYEKDLDNEREDDGKYYVLPTNCNTERIHTHGWLVRLDLLEAYGLEIPKTMDDVYAACKVFKEHNPDLYPLTNRFGSGNILTVVAPAFGTVGGWQIGNMFKYREDTDDWVFAPTSENYKAMLTWMNKMYAEGLLDQEFATLDSTVYEERAMNGSQFIMVDWINNQIRYNKDGPSQSGNEHFNIQPILHPIGPFGDRSGIQTQKYQQSWVINAQVAQRDDFDEVLAFIDWFYSDEAATDLSFGEEGLVYEVNASGRKVYIDSEFDHTKEYGIFNNSLTVRFDKDLFAANKDDYVMGVYEQITEVGAYSVPQPKIRLTEGDKTIEAIYRGPLLDYVNQMTEIYIFGAEDIDTTWDTFVEECRVKGSDKLDELYNTAYKNQK